MRPAPPAPGCAAQNQPEWNGWAGRVGRTMADATAAAKRGRGLRLTFSAEEKRRLRHAGELVSMGAMNGSPPGRQRQGTILWAKSGTPGGGGLPARFLPVALLLTILSAAPAGAEEVQVRDEAGLRAALAAARPGTRILLAEGSYRGGISFSNLRGQAGRPIVIASRDPQRPAVFRDGKTGLHLANPAHVELHDLEFTALSANGLNLDDGGQREQAGAHHVVLRRLRVHDTGRGGNEDGIKLSGLTDFRVEDCVVERWGDRGSGIDMVGCHRGAIIGNVFRHTAPPGANAVQCKGGSSSIVVGGNRFLEAGGRGVNIGGSTGLQFFRPPLAGAGPHAEARDIRVEGNTFVGGIAPVALVGVDGAVVRFNTIEKPGRWAIRILQENRAPGFVACRGGEFSDNVVVFDSNRWAEGGVNVGAGTEPATFRFARNWWYCADQPQRSQPRLPVAEAEGVYGRDPAAATGIAGATAWPARR